MRCEAIVELLSEYLDGVLSPDEAAQVACHLAECPSCREELQALHDTVACVNALPVVEPPADLVERVHAEIQEPGVASGTTSRPRWLIPFRLASAPMRVAIAAGLLAALGVYALRITAPPTKEAAHVAKDVASVVEQKTAADGEDMALDVADEMPDERLAPEPAGVVAEVAAAPPGIPIAAEEAMPSVAVPTGDAAARDVVGKAAPPGDAESQGAIWGEPVMTPTAPAPPRSRSSAKQSLDRKRATGAPREAGPAEASGRAPRVEMYSAVTKRAAPAAVMPEPSMAYTPMSESHDKAMAPTGVVTYEVTVDASRDAVMACVEGREERERRRQVRSPVMKMAEADVDAAAQSRPQDDAAARQVVRLELTREAYEALLERLAKLGDARSVIRRSDDEAAVRATGAVGVNAAEQVTLLITIVP